MSLHRLRFVAPTGISTQSDGIALTAVMSFLCCLVQSDIAQHSCTFLETGTILFSLRRRKRLLSIAIEHFLRQVNSKSVRFVGRERLPMTS